jgi:hypothetical protein
MCTVRGIHAIRRRAVYPFECRRAGVSEKLNRIGYTWFHFAANNRILISVMQVPHLHLHFTKPVTHVNAMNMASHDVQLPFAMAYARDRLAPRFMQTRIPLTR